MKHVNVIRVKTIEKGGTAVVQDYRTDRSGNRLHVGSHSEAVTLGVRL